MKQFYSLIFRMLLCMVYSAATIGAVTAQKSYIDENGASLTATTTALTGAETALTTGWYSISGTLTFTSRLVIQGDVTIILEDGCDAAVNGGISVNNGNSLTVYAQSDGVVMGKLTATAADTGSGIGANAGIGGDGNEDNDGLNCGTVVINGGYIVAYAGNRTSGKGFNGAGIGGGGCRTAGGGGHGGSITINGGKVEAFGGDQGAGIGGASQGDGGTIIINGGEVYAQGANGGAGIGGGQNRSSGSITINGGKITADGGSGNWGGGAGIGGGAGGGGATITINDGDVTATGGNSSDFGGGAGIGSGGTYPWNNAHSAGLITINGGTVIASGNSGKTGSGAGIGGGGGCSFGDMPKPGGAGGEIIITGGTVTAKGASSENGEGSPAIGGGQGYMGNGAPAKLTLSPGAKLITIPGGTADAIDANGIFFVGNEGTAYGDVTLHEDLTIKTGQTLHIPHGSSLNQNGYKIFVEIGGTIDNQTSATLILYYQLDPAWFSITSSHVYSGEAATGLTADNTKSINSLEYTVTSQSIDAGDATATVAYTGGGFYYGSCQVPFTISPVLLKIMPTANQGKIFGEADPPLTYTSNVTDIVPGNEITGDLGRIAGEDVGTYNFTLGTLHCNTNNYNIIIDPAAAGVKFTVGEYQRGLIATPASHDFGSVYPGYKPSQTPAPLTVTLQNNGIETVDKLTFKFASSGSIAGFQNVASTVSGNDDIAPFTKEEIIVGVKNELPEGLYRDTLLVIDGFKGDTVARIPLQFNVYETVPPTINRSVFLPPVNGATLSPREGIHWIPSREDFEFTVTAHNGYDLIFLKVSTGTWRDDTPGYIDVVLYGADGLPLTNSARGAAAASARVRIRFVNENINVSFSGISPLANETVSGKPTLKAWTAGKTLNVSGLQKGERFEVYNLIGVLIHSSVATDAHVQQVALPAIGVYLVKTSRTTLKVTQR
jgi:hypothetical protein